MYIENINKYKYDDITIGLEESFMVAINEEMMKKFCEISGDINPLHIDVSHARNFKFQDKVVYGMLTASFLSTLAGVYLPGERSIIHNIDIKFPNPVYVGDKLTIKGEVVFKDDLSKTIEVKFTIVNQNERKVCRGKMLVGVLADE